eukprot:2228954-Prymnesium_polylepis.1
MVRSPGAGRSTISAELTRNSAAFSRHGTVLYPPRTCANMCEPVANPSRTFFASPSRIASNLSRTRRDIVAN